MLPDNLDKKCTSVAIRFSLERRNQLRKNIVIRFQQAEEYCITLSLPNSLEALGNLG